jgi:hypothetical protein
MPTVSESSIEHAWALVARGLHIHRYFLHVDPMVNRRLAAQLHSQSEPLEAHGFEPGHPDSWQSALLEALPLHALQLAIRQIRDWDVAATRGIVLYTNVADSIVVTPAAREPALMRALDLVSAQDAGWLVRLTAGALESAHGAISPTPRFRPRVLSVDLDNEPAAIADELLRQGAVQLLQLFAIARHEHSVLEGAPADELLGPCAALLEPLYAPFTAGLVTPPSSESVADEPQLTASMRAAIDAVSYLPFTDLLETTLSWGRRFQKFADGLAPGQHA